MKQLLALIQNEFLALLRTGKITVLLIVFSIFGILNPALAKLTPWMLSLMSQSLSDQGITFGNIAVNALTAWTQYFKNLFMEYVLLLALFGGIFASEYQSGTLVNILTKGLPRWKVALSKWLVVFVCWSVCSWLTFGITFGYSAYFWGGDVAFASAFTSGMNALLCTGAVYALLFALGLLPSIAPWLPVRLNDSLALLTGDLLPADFTRAILTTGVFSLVNLALCIAGFQRKQL